MSFKFWPLSNFEIDDYYHGNNKYNGTVSKDMLKGTPKMGYYICNMEKSNHHGTHWVLMSIFPKYSLYMDPFGIIADPMMIKFMRKHKKPIFYNTTQYQDMDSDACGWWCIYMIDHMMAGYKFLDLMGHFSNNTKKNEKILKDYFMKHKLISHEGLVKGGSLLGVFKKIGNVIKEGVDRVSHFISGERNMYPPQVRKAYDQFKNDNIQEMYVSRVPINSFIDKVVDLISTGEYKKQKDKLHYDQLYHMFFLLKLKGKWYRLEYNHVVQFSPYGNELPKDKEIVRIPNNLKFGDFLLAGPKKYPNGFFSYNPISNNCQDYVVKMLDASNLDTPSLKAFVKQDAKSLFKSTPSISQRILGAITQLASRGDILVSGHGFLDFLV